MSPSRLVADVVLLCVLTQFHTDSIARNCGLSSRMTIFVYITIYICPDILVNCNSIPHLPAVERLGGVDGNEWFLSPLYQPLKAANVKSWTQYRALEAAVKEVTDGYTHLPKSSPDRMYRQLMRVAGVLESKNFPAIAMAVETLAGYAADYETWGFEVAPRNLGVGVDGELILLDCLFCVG